jgi:hypothetical protein
MGWKGREKKKVGNYMTKLQPGGEELTQEVPSVKSSSGGSLHYYDFH